MTVQRFSIIGAIDESDQARHVLERVADEAARYDAADLHFLRVIDVKQKYADRIAFDDERDALVAEIKNVFESFITAKSTCRLHVHMRVGRPDEEIIALAHETRADVIVIGHHGAGSGGEGHRERRRFAGNTVERLLRTAPCTVLVVQDRIYDAAPADQCAACVKVRAESAGEIWFCEKHRDNDRPLHINNTFGGLSFHTVGFGSGGVF